VSSVCRGRAAAPCPVFTGWVSAIPTCPWRRDSGAPVAVSHDRDGLWPEHLDVAVAYLPRREVAADKFPLTEPGVSFADPTENPVPCVMAQITEGLRRHTMSEIVTPSPQHGIYAAQQIAKRSMFVSGSERSNLCHHREQALLRWVGVDRSFPGSTASVAALDAPPEEVESSSMWQTLVFSSDRRKPIGAST
jgi:hypothetical protein